jgi:hypothetical protein
MECTFLSRLPRFLFTRHLPLEEQEQGSWREQGRGEGNIDDGLEYICFTGSREDGEQRAGSKRQDHRHGDAPVLYTGGALIAAAHDTTTIAAASSLRNPAPQA